MSDLLAAFDALAAQQPAALAQRLTTAGIPAAAQHPAQADLVLVLAALRSALTGWYPRPPLQDAEEHAAFREALADIVAAEIDAVAAPYVERAGRTAMRTRSRLNTWNTTRAERLSRPSYADLAPLREKAPDEDANTYNTYEVRDLGDGRYQHVYHVKPEPPIDLTLRHRNERSTNE